MTKAHELKIFLASSSELELERAHVGDLVNDINSHLLNTFFRIRLLKWEIFDHEFKGERKQSEYNQQIKKSDIFLVLFRSKFGKFTIEEKDVALHEHTENQKPKELYCFIQEYQEKRDFDARDLVKQLGSSFVMGSYMDTNELKQNLLKILKPHICSSGVHMTETEKYFIINSENFLRKK